MNGDALFEDIEEETYRLVRGTEPLLLSIPHAGTDLPREIADVLTEEACSLADTDFWVDQLYLGQGVAAAREAGGLGASVITARTSRYVIDLNRNPSGQSLYPGMITTGLIPEESFSGSRLYRSGVGPDKAELIRRLRRWFLPYHTALASELMRLKALHGYVVLYDCHSIRSCLPRLFAGELPAFNIGSCDGRSCASDLVNSIAAVLSRAESFDYVIDGRFKGGWITRHYGRPEDGVHAIQMEIAQRVYMQETPPRYDEIKSAQIGDVLRSVLEAILAWVKTMKVL